MGPLATQPTGAIAIAHARDRWARPRASSLSIGRNSGSRDSSRIPLHVRRASTTVRRCSSVTVTRLHPVDVTE